ncbi:hypothetical protein EV140_1927 [Microcella alkaliphila]|uniref:Uncharacterized protein n=1 Tax=Microcella alkaliphila TaxID=279828 RepID=A0A4Q7TJ95_9MICO|nr:hypothetical protein [Microcella alkaliphila]RZT59322.1 hypothetical protein EV140_1927 [Microcella alkaliphila]
MAGQDTAQNAATAKAAAEKAAAEKAAAEKAAAEKAETERAKAAEAAANALQVIGPVAVLPLKSGGERYVYRGTAISDEFTDEGIKHAKSVGLVGKPKK